MGGGGLGAGLSGGPFPMVIPAFLLGSISRLWFCSFWFLAGVIVIGISNNIYIYIYISNNIYTYISYRLFRDSFILSAVSLYIFLFFFI